MKRTATAHDIDEPMGIMIAIGARAEVQPLVRAYVWAGFGEDVQPATAGQQPFAMTSGR